MKESKTLELKENITNTFLKTVSAFANFGDGTILFGVNDEGNVVGIEHAEESCLDIEHTINDSIKPKPDFTLSITNENAIELKVFEGKYKPYVYKGKAYRRSGTSSVEVDMIELRRLALEGSNLFYDQLACAESNLSFSYLEKKLHHVLDISTLDTDILRSLGFYTKDMKYNNAAALFADRNTFSGVDIVRFGETINVILERETISNTSLLEQYDKALERYRRNYQYEVIEGSLRQKRELVPEDAFREALANALVHRDYDVHAHIRIAMFKNKIEISSPGGLPFGVKKEEYLHGTLSVLKNPIIGNLFFRLGLIETLGTGIRRINEAYREHDIKPMYTILDQSITVELPSTTAEYEVTGDESEIIEALQGGAILSSSEIANRTGFSKSKVVRLMKHLEEKRYVSVSGGGRSTKYSLR
jgi:ATP-dependent DNA helicase RecG